jgi:hypothetical protein
MMDTSSSPNLISLVRLALAVLLFLGIGQRPAKADSSTTVYLPLVLRSARMLPSPPADKNDIQAYVNYFRSLVGSPPIILDSTLNNNCAQHARYVAVNAHLTHFQDPGKPFASSQGQHCARNGNVWMGMAWTPGYWQPGDSVESWMHSVGHRLWLLYPTTTTFGYGFYTGADASHRAGAALDVQTDYDYRREFDGWPIRYPTDGQRGIIPSQYPISLSWEQGGPTPTIHATSLTSAAGVAIPHTYTTSLPSGHQGVVITPSQLLFYDTDFTVSVQGEYKGSPFTQIWTFSTKR